MIKSAWTILKQAGRDFAEDRATTSAAGVAFYTALSFAPLIVLMISIGQWLGPDAQAQLIDEIRNVIGGEAAGVVDTIVENAEQQDQKSGWAFGLSLAVALFSASGVFGQLQAALNHVWEVKPKPGQGVLGWIRKRVLSIGMIGGLVFILLASLGVSVVLGYILPQWEGVARIGSVLVSLVVYVPLFMLIFKVLPDAEIGWRDVLFGSTLTAVLFLIGKTLIGLYLGNSAVGSAYGAAGSLVVLLVWVYYSAIILLMGAEITQARAKHLGQGIRPNEHTVRIDTSNQPIVDTSDGDAES